MMRLGFVARSSLVAALGFGVAAACGSDDGHKAARDDAGGAAGHAEAGGASDDGDGAGVAGEAASGTPSASGGAGAGGGASEPGDDPAGGFSSGGAGGVGGESVDFGEPTNVNAFGCFIHSGDGGDLLADGSIAVNVTNPVYGAACDSAWVSSNADAYAPEQTPTTLIMRRAFILDSTIGAGDFSITYKADDAIDFLLNGNLIIGCSAPNDNPGLCQQVCTTSSIPPSAFKPAGEVNQLEARLINTFSVAAGNGNFGYTALNYSVCVAPAQ